MSIGDWSGQWSGRPETLLVSPLWPTVATHGERTVILVMDDVVWLVHPFGDPAYRVTHSFAKLPGSREDVRVQAEFGGFERPYPVDPEEERLARQAVAVAARAAAAGRGRLRPEWPWFARVDMLVDPDSEEGLPAILELELIEPSLFFGLQGAPAVEGGSGKGAGAAKGRKDAATGGKQTVKALSNLLYGVIVP